ncbi:hypothetical protein EYR40_008390 [Pleurotus pulmonarius]|nr:hypothetical protein EYR40_008390 [Pleurotus pulmonarius]
MSQPTVPSEIWKCILSHLKEPQILKICQVNRVFYDIAADYRYRHLRLRSMTNAEVFMLHRVRDPWLAKRVKSLCISIDAMSQLVTRYSVPRRRWWHAGTKESPPIEQAPHERTTEDAEALSTILLDAIRGMKNVQEVEIHAGSIATGELEFELELMQLLCSRFRSVQILKLWSPIDKLHLVLPTLQFCNLKEAVLLLYGQSEASADILSRVHHFLRLLAPTLEHLTLCAYDHEVVSRISSLFHRDVVMSKLKTLSTLLTFDDLRAIQSINTNYPALAELSLAQWMSGTTASLGQLQLPSLRSLELMSGAVRIPQGFWNGSSSFTQLEKSSLWSSEALSPSEVSQMCRFFATSLNITKLLLRVEVLEAELFDSLAFAFPSLHSLTLEAQSVGNLPPGIDLIASFEADMEDRCYPDWGLSSLQVSRAAVHDRDTAAILASKKLTNVVKRSIPSLIK